ncbi:aspartate kinase [Fibrisoma montanum]|uniref:Aspartokinase n=1 Tax=Fibrisoma montanum TaxID=2305895 RepID=A0A418M801_9BACT|nr:aspartate kinase [Fibrisoma montanum]RIV22269.1 aspartate kinase [Fibrisoma montanum]
MNVFKFGGASVKEAAGVRNLARIIQTQGEGAVVVVSAMGKTTNALEEVVRAYAGGDTDEAVRRWGDVRAYHEGIMRDLAGNHVEENFQSVLNTFAGVETYLHQSATGSFDQIYDQIVSIGEVVSTQIVAAFLNVEAVSAYWADARELVFTDATYREGKVDWEQTSRQIQSLVATRPKQEVIVTQGFIGRAPNGLTTTLGREGSDYTAAIFAYCLDAESVTIWKDVPGVLNADPKWFDDTVLLERITYQDAIELAYYGATVIHPKTIKPLQNKGIPLYVRSFVEPEKPGTAIGDFEQHLLIPSFIFKINQVLISLHPKDFSFIAEDNLSLVFGQFAQAGVKINLMQNTAISFSVVIDQNPSRVPALLEQLRQSFRVNYNEGLELITIRYYDQSTVDRVLINKKLLLEQKSRYTVQLVVKDLGQAM